MNFIEWNECKLGNFPKDSGKYYLVFYPQAVGSNIRIQKYNNIDNSWSVIGDGDYLGGDPTHWSELPKPPGSNDNKKLGFLQKIIRRFIHN